jgi:hypothetical protein
MTVVQYEQPEPLPPSLPGQELEPGPRGDVARLRAAAEYAAYIGDTEFVPDTLRGRPAAITAALLAGDELGLKKMVALRVIAIIRGRPTLTSEAQRGLVTARGHELWFEESTTTRAIACGRRVDSDRIGRVTWTMDDAKRAGIAGGEAWRRYPAEMLRARASAALARAMFADVTLGIPAAEELEGEENGYQHGPPPPPPSDAIPAPATGRTRRRRAAPKPGPAAGPAQAPPPPQDQPEPGGATEPGWTEGQKRRMFALMRDAGFTEGDRDARLAYASRIIGRQIASANELLIGEADMVNNDLEEIIKLPESERPARMLGANEAVVVAELEQMAAEGLAANEAAVSASADPDATSDPRAEPGQPVATAEEAHTPEDDDTPF